MPTDFTGNVIWPDGVKWIGGDDDRNMQPGNRYIFAVRHLPDGIILINKQCEWELPPATP